jgi:hypothetical protein
MKILSLFLLFIVSRVAIAEEWQNIGSIPAGSWDTLTWRSKKLQCEIVASKLGWASHALESNSYVSITLLQAKEYAGEGCNLPEHMQYILVRGVYFGGNGSFGIGETENNLVVIYQGLSKQPTFQKSALIVAVNGLPEKVFVGAHVVQ